MARQHGYKGEIALDDTGAGTTFTAVASMNAFTIDMKRELVDVSCFGDTNRQYVQGLPDIKGSLNGVFDPATTPDQLIRIAMGDTPVFMRLTPSTLTPTTLFKGLAYLDTSLSVSSSGAITVSGTYSAAGPWVLEPAAP